MHKILWLSVLSAALMFGACGNSTGEPSSTPIDSTNVHGTAPVNYDNGNDTGSRMLPDEPTEAHRANTPGGDSIPSTAR